MDRVNPKARKDAYGSRINRAHSPMLVFAVPAISVMVASMVPFFFIVGGIPLIPPLGFLMLLGWRLVRPGLFPIWIGFPLGLFDDLFSGQPFGSAIVLWSVAMIVIEIIETQLPRRSFVQDWLIYGIIILSYILVSALFSGAPIDAIGLAGIMPQSLLSLLLFPLFARLVARLDRLRLTRFRTVT